MSEDKKEEKRRHWALSTSAPRRLSLVEAGLHRPSLAPELPRQLPKSCLSEVTGLTTLESSTMSNIYWPAQMVQALKLGSMHRTHRVSVSYNPNARMAAAVLLQHGFISSVSLGTAQGPDPSGFRELDGHPRAQMLWLDLKFRDHRPVIGNATTVSKPGLKLYFSPGEMKTLMNGGKARFVDPFERGEIGIVRTGEAVMSMGEAVMRNVSGEIVMRISSE